MKDWFWIVLILWVGQASADTVKDLTALGLSETKAQTILQRWADRHPNQSPESFVQVIQAATQNGAPVDLITDKAAEGLAKGVPPQRLINALTMWGKNLGQAAQTVRELRQSMAPGDVSDQEAILRVSVLQRTQKDKNWLDDLKTEAQKNKIDLQKFLNVGEAVGHLTNRLGLKKKEAEQLGILWMKENMSTGDIGKHIRAIEIGQNKMPIVQASRLVVENAMGGMSPDDILSNIQAAKEDNNRASRDNPSANNRVGNTNKENGRPESAGSAKEKENNGKGPNK